MEKSPLITIITVTYNAEKVIGKTLQSLREQSFRDFEHLVIDGASSDQTLEIIESARLPMTRITSEPDKGLYDAMNKGLHKASGKYVLFLNAGDTFHSEDTLSLFAQKASQNADIIYGDTIIVDSKGEKLADRHLAAPEVLTPKSFSKGMLICHQAFMVKKSLAPDFDLSYRFSADYDWCVKCINNADTSHCQNLKTVTTHYLSDGLTDNNKFKSLRERFRIMSNHYGRFTTIFNHIGFVLRALKRKSI